MNVVHQLCIDSRGCFQKFTTVIIKNQPGTLPPVVLFTQMPGTYQCARSRTYLSATIGQQDPVLSLGGAAVTVLHVAEEVA